MCFYGAYALSPALPPLATFDEIRQPDLMCFLVQQVLKWIVPLLTHPTWGQSQHSLLGRLREISQSQHSLLGPLREFSQSQHSLLGRLREFSQSQHSLLGPLREFSQATRSEGLARGWASPPRPMTLRRQPQPQSRHAAGWCGLAGARLLSRNSTCQPGLPRAVILNPGPA